MGGAEWWRAMTSSESTAGGRERTLLEGALERVVYRDADRGFSVVEVVLRDGRRVTVTGNLLGARVGEHLRVEGDWQEHPKFGRQVRARTVEVVPPSTIEGVRAYLASGLVKGVGPALAERIVAQLGSEALESIEREPEKLRRVPGIGPKRAREIAEAIALQKGLRELVTYLGAHGVGSGAAQRIWRHYGADALRFVRENPFRLADEVWGFGFRKADEIAGKLGLAADAPERARAGLVFALTEAAGQGHSCLPREVLTEQAKRLLGLDDRPIAEALAACVDAKLISLDEPAERNRKAAEPTSFVYLPVMLAAERIVARRVVQLTEARLGQPIADARAVAAMEARLRFEADPLQRRAVETALREPMVVITGGPGVGKTTIVRQIVELTKASGLTVALASPTGRAARRLSEATRHEATTLHRLLEFQPRENVFLRNEKRPLRAAIVIVDEVSMLDIQLAAHLLRAVATPTRLVFVGDADQLPSVGPGNFLRDVVESGRVAVVRLTRIFRQGEGSAIVAGAHRVLAGETPVFTREATGRGDLFFVERNDPLDALKGVLHVVTERIPDRFRLDPRRQVQVIAPMYRGEVGIDRINRELRERLNPPEAGAGGGEKSLRVRDRVMVTRNDVDKDVFNGDVGRVEAVNSRNRSVLVRFGDRLVSFEDADAAGLVLAYAISVHRSQGSEYPAVVIPLVTQHFVMLRRALLYTAMTRARELCVLVGSRRALDIAVREARVEERFSRLKERLMT